MFCPIKIRKGPSSIPSHPFDVVMGVAKITIYHKIVSKTNFVFGSTLKNISPGPSVVGEDGRGILVGGASDPSLLGSNLRLRCPTREVTIHTVT